MHLRAGDTVHVEIHEIGALEIRSSLSRSYGRRLPLAADPLDHHAGRADPVNASKTSAEGSTQILERPSVDAGDWRCKASAIAIA
jgi:hypothetical protein